MSESGVSKKRLSDERGQAMSEYVILIVVVSLGLIPFYKLLPQAVAGYVRPFYYCISRSIP